ncbi:MAG TPA: hypothetical protein VMG62_03685, partial [Solirubrobacteraceae bacterium]|nr:hypothetical protein [Solirubrobacteraceae bacterium]
YLEAFAPDLRCGVMQSELPQAAPGSEGPDLPAGESVEERVSNLYLWREGQGYTLITDVKPANSGERQSDVVDGVSGDCGHVIFESGYRFLGAPAGSLYEWSETAPGQGTLALASILPDGRPAQGAGAEGSAVTPVVGGEKGSDLHELSSDGSQVVFTATVPEGEASAEEVFARFLAPAPKQAGERTTVEVSAAQTGPPHLDTGAKFQAASASGERVFFTANYGLTTSSSGGTDAATRCEATGGGCDLYVYERKAGATSGTLKDLSVDVESVTGDTEGASVQSMLGLSEDGSVIYFATAGQLVKEQGNSEAANVSGKEANVYAERIEGAKVGSPEYVATIYKLETGTNGAGHQEEALDALAGPLGMHYTASRVSRTGEYLLFATRHRVREYDGVEYENLDRKLGTPDFESYEYRLAPPSSPTPGASVCVTCEPDRAVRPLAASGPPQGPSGAYQVNHLGYLTRTLGAAGEVFFNGIDPLTGAANNTVNVYEWRPDGWSLPEGLARCESANGCVGLLDSGADSHASYFADASEDGGDVYITTQQALVAQDRDGLRDVYDVRIGGGVPAPVVSPRCTGEACQGAGGNGQTPTGNFASESGAAGNLSPTSTPGSGGGGVAAFNVHSLSVRRTVRGTKVAVGVLAPGAGRVAIAGAGLRGISRAVSRAGVYRLTVALTGRERRVLARRRHVRVRLRVAFTARGGHASAAAVYVTFLRR